MRELELGESMRDDRAEDDARSAGAFRFCGTSARFRCRVLQTARLPRRAGDRARPRCRRARHVETRCREDGAVGRPQPGIDHRRGRIGLPRIRRAPHPRRDQPRQPGVAAAALEGGRTAPDLGAGRHHQFLFDRPGAAAAVYDAASSTGHRRAPGPRGEAFRALNDKDYTSSGRLRDRRRRRGARSAGHRRRGQRSHRGYHRRAARMRVVRSGEWGATGAAPGQHRRAARFERGVDPTLLRG